MKKLAAGISGLLALAAAMGIVSSRGNGRTDQSSATSPAAIQQASRELASAPAKPALPMNPARPVAAAAAPKVQALTMKALGRVPLTFEENVGQAEPSVKYLARSKGYSLLLTEKDAVIALTKRNAAEGRTELLPLRMRFAGGASPAALQGENAVITRTYYQTPGRREMSRADNFAAVRMKQVYPGIDVVYRGNARQAQFDFEVAPGSKPSQIAIEFEGAERLSIEPGGDLAIAVKGETLHLRRPYIYQERDGQREEVSGSFVLAGENRVRFELAAYDAARPLVIDPTIDFATYLGGTQFDSTHDIEVSAQGDVFVLSFTNDYFNFPTTDLVGQAFITKTWYVTRFNATLDTVVYSVAFTDAYSCSHLALGPNDDLYVSCLSANDLNTYVGIVSGSSGSFTFNPVLFPEFSNTGYGNGEIRDLKVDAAGKMYVLGDCAKSLAPPTFPNGVVANSRPTHCVAGDPNSQPESIVVKRDASGQLEYGTYLRGTTGFTDYMRALAIDNSGKVYVVGRAGSFDIPTTAPNPFPASASPAQGYLCDQVYPCEDPYLAVIDTTQTGAASLVYAVRMESAAFNEAVSVQVDAAGVIHILGLTSNYNFPISTNAYSSSLAIPSDMLFLVKIDPQQPTGFQLVYSTVLDNNSVGSAGPQPVELELLPGGAMAFLMLDDSNTFPQVSPLLVRSGSGNPIATVGVLDPTGSRLLFSSYLDDSETMGEAYMAADPAGNLYIAGITQKDGAATPGSFQEVRNGSTEILVFRIAGIAGGTSNHAPTITMVSNFGGPYFAGGLGIAVVLAQVNDADGDPLSYTWTGPFGTRTGTANGGDWLQLEEYFPVGTSQVTLTVDDGQGGVAVATTQVDIVDNTPASQIITVMPGNESNPTSGGGVVTLTFTNVTSPGNTTMTIRRDLVPLPPPHLQAGSPPYYYDLSTTATFSGSVTICIWVRSHSFADPSFSLYQLISGTWTQIPSTLNTFFPGFPELCGQTNSLGTFAIFSPEVPANRISTVAGTIPFDWQSDPCTGPGADPNEGGPATASRLWSPEGAVLDSARNYLYFTERCGHRVRRIDLTTGLIRTVAGTGVRSLSGSGNFCNTAGICPGDTAALSTDPATITLNSPSGVALDPAGNLYIAENLHARILKLSFDASGNPTTIVPVVGTGIAGFSGDGGPASAAQISFFGVRIRTDASGNLYIADYNNRRLRYIPAGADGTIDGSEIITTIAGGGSNSPSTTPADPLTLDLWPKSLALAPNGDLYVANVSNSQILRIQADSDGRVDGSSGELATVFTSNLVYTTVSSDSLALMPNGDLVWGSGFCNSNGECFGPVSRRTPGADGIVDGSSDEVRTTVAGYYDWASVPAPTIPVNSDGDGHGLSARVQFPTAILPVGNGQFYLVDADNGLIRLTGYNPTPTPTNWPPFALVGNGFAPSGQATPFYLQATDAENDPLTYTIVTPPAHGVLSGTPPNLFYTSNPGYVGPDSFTFKANDGHADGNIAMVAITVQGSSTNSAPLANAGPDQTLEATSTSGATVTLDGSASADPDPGDTLSYSWSGPCGSSSAALAVFTCPLGTSTMTLVVTDSGGLSHSDTVDITVTDTTPPTVALPASVTVEATSAAGAVVHFLAGGTDIADPAPVATCTPASGSTFPLGTTTVNCFATDASGNTSTSGSFNVTVQDTTGPTVTPPADIVIYATEFSTVYGARGNVSPQLAAFLAGGSATDAVTASPTALPPQFQGVDADNNTFFPLGVNSVTFRFQDAAGNIGTATASVTVQQPAGGAPTSAGSNVSVSPTDANGVAQPVTLSFSGVTQPGLTTANASPTGPPLPPNFQLKGVYYDISTTAIYTPPITICFSGNFLPGDTLLHYENGAWVTLPNQVLLPPTGPPFTQLCALTNSLSPFAVGAPVNHAPSASAGTNQTVEATSAAGASVTLNGAGSDPDNDTLSFAWSGPCGNASTAVATLTCPLGTSTMTLTVDDGRGGSASATVQITVQDTTAPALTLPGNIVVEATGAAGAAVNYTATAQDAVTGAVAVSCAPASGTVFALGTTTVNCSASDGVGNSAAGSFSVTVRDTTPPTLSLPANITVTISSGTGTTVNYTASAHDLVSGSITPACTPASGSTFPVGTTTVNCTAQDAAGNSAAGSFSVTVQLSGGSTPPPPELRRITPSSGARGKTVVIYLSGLNLREQLTTQISGSGVQVLRTTRISNTFAIATVNIDANAPTGPRSLTVSNAYGTSNALTFTVQ